MGNQSKRLSELEARVGVLEGACANLTKVAAGQVGYIQQLTKAYAEANYGHEQNGDGETGSESTSERDTETEKQETKETKKEEGDGDRHTEGDAADSLQAEPESADGSDG